MHNGLFNLPAAVNEPVINYEPGSPERKAVDLAIEDIKANPKKIPLRIGQQTIETGDVKKEYAPHDKSLLLAEYHQAGENEIKMAVDACRKAWESWSVLPWQHRAAIFLKAADLLANKYRHIANAAVMLAHSKNYIQAELDTVELIDFWRFNASYIEEIYAGQPYSPELQWNRVEYRPLEGFVLAITPFNFVAIGGNLPTAPAMMGNVSIWKPASSVVRSNYLMMEILREAGLPEDVIVFLPSSGKMIGQTLLTHPELAGVHFTGSTEVFQQIWRTIGENIDTYNSYPRIVGETGGKDFVVAHKTADVDITATALLRGAFEFQGQKCSAASRAYIPKSLWPKIKEQMQAKVKEFSKGDPGNGAFFNAVIDKAAFDSIVGYIEKAKASDEAKIVMGGDYSEERGYFIDPCVIETTNPRFVTMEEEIFGPVLSVYVYEDDDFIETLELCEQTSPYGLTGAIIASDRYAITQAETILQHAAGNFYINDKPTGSVVGQQPFGGGRLSGTNDKAGSVLNLQRWMSTRAIKENLLPPTDYRYPFMG